MKSKFCLKLFIFLVVDENRTNLHFEVNVHKLQYDVYEQQYVTLYHHVLYNNNQIIIKKRIIFLDVFFLSILQSFARTSAFSSKHNSSNVSLL